MNFANLDAFMDRLVREKSPGCAVCVYMDDQLVHTYAAGFADLATREPMDIYKQVFLYSCSKVMTVTVALQLLERGEFLLDDPLSAYVPAFAHMAVRQPDGSLADAKQPITIRHLFTMTAGFDYNFNSAGHHAARAEDPDMETATVLRHMADNPLSFEPGSHWQYSLCHDALAGLVSVIAGMPFRTYVQKNILDPLAIDCAYHLTPERASRMASQYRFVPDGADADFDIVEAQKYGKPTSGTYVNVGKTNNHIIGAAYDSGGAGVITCAAEYAKFVAALARGGLGLNGARILSPATVRLMHTDQLTPAQRADFNWSQLAGYGYGLGVRTMIDPARGGALSPIGEFGWGGAAGATVLADTQNRLAVVFVQHMLNPQEGYYQPRLRNVIYGGVGA